MVPGNKDYKIEKRRLTLSFLYSVNNSEILNILKLFAELRNHKNRSKPSFSYFTLTFSFSNITATCRELITCRSLHNTTNFYRHQIILIFSELLANNNKNFFTFHIIIKNCWYFRRDTGKQYYTLFQSLYQAILTFSESSFQSSLW